MSRGTAEQQLKDAFTPWVLQQAVALRWIQGQPDDVRRTLLKEAEAVALREGLRSFSPNRLEDRRGEPNPFALSHFLDHLEHAVRKHCSGIVYETYLYSICSQVAKFLHLPAREGTKLTKWAKSQDISGLKGTPPPEDPDDRLKDLLGCARLAFVERLDKFNPDRAQFRTFLVRQVYWECLAQAKGASGLPPAAAEAVPRVRRAVEALEQAGKDPTVDAVKAHVDLDGGKKSISEQSIKQILSRVYVSLDADQETKDGDAARPLVETIANTDDGVEQTVLDTERREEAPDEVAHALAKLPPKYQVLSLLRSTGTMTNGQTWKNRLGLRSKVENLTWEQIVCLLRDPTHPVMSEAWPPRSSTSTSWYLKYQQYGQKHAHS